MVTPEYQRIAFCLIAITTIGACDRVEVDSSRAVDQDSSGLAVLDLEPPYPTFALAPAPLLRVGTVDGPPDHQLSGVVYAARMTDGRLVLIDGGSSEVRWYSPEGELEGTAGGFGDGPGELRHPASAALADGDTLMVYDPQTQRMTLFAPGGHSFRTRPLELGSGSNIHLHPVSHGEYVIAEERLELNFGGEEYNPTRDSLLVMRGSVLGEELDTILRIPGREAITWVDYVDGRPAGTRQMPVPFGQRPLTAAVGDKLILVKSGESTLSILELDGALERLVRRVDVEPPAVSTATRRRFVDAAIQARPPGIPEQWARQAAEDRIDLLPEGRHLPAFDRIIVDRSANRVWLRDYVPNWREDASQTWTVHGLDGEVAGRITTPPGLQVTQVTKHHLVGIETDSVGVESVVVYSFD